jgi:hypothetical protein
MKSHSPIVAFDRRVGLQSHHARHPSLCCSPEEKVVVVVVVGIATTGSAFWIIRHVWIAG